MTSSPVDVLRLDPAVSITRAQVESVVARYAEAMSRADAEAIAHLFAFDATRNDPVGGTAQHGREEIRDAIRKALPGPPARIRFHPGAVHGQGNVFAFAFDHTVSRGESRWTLHGIDVFAFTADGLIGHAVAYWGPDDRK